MCAAQHDSLGNNLCKRTKEQMLEDLPVDQPSCSVAKQTGSVCTSNCLEYRIVRVAGAKSGRGPGGVTSFNIFYVKKWNDFLCLNVSDGSTFEEFCRVTDDVVSRGPPESPVT